jgi:hypothetical protein
MSMEYKTTIHNAETGEIITRDMTEQETKNYEALCAAEAAKEAETAANAIAKAALLERLGITEDEAKLLLS